MPMKGFKNQPVENANMDILRSKNPNIRLFTVKRTSTFTPQTDVVGTWKEATPANVRDFSATAYYFGRLINEYWMFLWDWWSPLGAVRLARHG